MLKSIILEACDFQKELQSLLLQSDSEPDLQLIVCKALCNLAIDFQKNMAKEYVLVKKLVEMTTYADNPELKTAACFTLKNLLFKSGNEVKTTVMKELTPARLLDLMEDPHLKVQEQALMIYRNLLYGGEQDVQQVLTEGGDKLLSILDRNLDQSLSQQSTQPVML